MNDQNISLNSLYQEIIMEHYKDPRNFKALENPDVSVEGFNPLCGDRVTLALKLSQPSLPKDRSIDSVGIQGQGCSICLSSASMMGEEIEKKSLEQAAERVFDFRMMMQGRDDKKSFEGTDVQALSGVQAFPVRIKCALLPWTTLNDALSKLGIKTLDLEDSE